MADTSTRAQRARPRTAYSGAMVVETRPELRHHHTAAVAVVGLGYVGLPTALALTAAGARVLGIDTSSERLGAIRRGDVDVIERDRARLSTAHRSGQLTTSADSGQLTSADTVLVCVPTPVDEHLVPDLGPLRAACASVVAAARPGQCLILTSTSHVGATRDLLIDPLEARGFRVGVDIHVSFSPERIDPGNSYHSGDRVTRVLGGATAACSRRSAEVLGQITPTVHVVSSPEAAELTKLLENTFRAVNIAFANEMADVAGHFSLDITEIVDAAATKPFGFMPFRPGPGVGGHCIPCDPHYLLWTLRSRRAVAPVIEAAMNQIAIRPTAVVSRALSALADRGRTVSGARILLMGVAYKPGVEDLRESPALEILNRLAALGAKVEFTDPKIASLVRTSGEVLYRVPDPQDEAWDMVVVMHTPPTDVDIEWLSTVPAVLDTTYGLMPAHNRVVP
jgi:UDP-N-acetyl-D-glucosamine dehydrogenase